MRCCTPLGSLLEKGTVPFVTWHHHQSLHGHFSRDSQLAVITTLSSNCSYLGSEENHALVTSGVHLGYTCRAYWEGWWHLHGILSGPQNLPLQKASFLQQRLKADDEGDLPVPMRKCQEATLLGVCFLAPKSTVMLDGTAQKSVLTNFDSLFSRCSPTVCFLPTHPEFL